MIVFSVAGNLYFAAVSRLENLLPAPATNGGGSVVILRLRDNRYLGSTGISFLREYARKLEAGGGRLVLAAVSQDVLRQLDRTGEADWLEPIFPRRGGRLCLDPARPRLGEGLVEATGARKKRRIRIWHG